jgi:hypothetical protein
MLRTGTPSVNNRAWYPPDIGEPGRGPHAPARTTGTRDTDHYDQPGLVRYGRLNTPMIIDSRLTERSPWR